MSDHWVDRAQNAEAVAQTARDGNDRLKEKIRSLKETLCATELSNGEIDIDFEKLVGKMKPEQALQLRAAIDDIHSISGAAGEKPRIRLSVA